MEQTTPFSVRKVWNPLPARLEQTGAGARVPVFEFGQRDTHHRRASVDGNQGRHAVQFADFLRDDRGACLILSVDGMPDLDRGALEFTIERISDAAQLRGERTG